MREIKSKYTKDGIMRRNKLLLEHILHDRLERSISTIYYYKCLEEFQENHQRMQAVEQEIRNPFP